MFREELIFRVQPPHLKICCIDLAFQSFVLIDFNVP